MSMGAGARSCDAVVGSYDVVVVGGGVVGLASALALAAAGREVAVVERAPPCRRRGALGSDLRSVALTPASVEFLRSMVGGLERGLAPVLTMRVWEHDGAGALRFGRAGAPLAWVAENSVLATSLWRAVADRADCVPAALASLTRASDAAILELDNGVRLRARLVVAADGPHSLIRRAATTLRSERPPRNGPEQAVATVARLAAPHQSTAWQCFGATGPVALLPLAEARTASVIWSGATASQEALLTLDDDDFRAALAARTEGVAGGVVAVDRRLSFPIAQTLAADLNPWPRLVLAGDAARTLHPLAGQGVNVGLEDARQIAATAGASGDPGADGRWRAYAAARRRRSKLMISAMGGLRAAYCRGAEGPWTRLARNAAIRRIAKAPLVRARLVHEAMGLGPLAA